ncbi:glycosyltransferase [uncultured Prochlorococcus sp.]|uniref:glycosyltransferase n=1 Tax=uncultured Prochlorococcus sp. TaxID=159733 RepID=UPI00258D082B|nr:glycosyltransferase [uncultured Prochlorococcus sp.]
MNIKDTNIALVHDWYLKKSISGSEKVTLIIDELLSNNYSVPELFSLTENISQKNQSLFGNRKINTSLIQKLPLGRDKVQKYLPIIPFAIEQFDLSRYEIIISSSHIAAKGVITSPDQLHISYIHTPMRYAWDQMNTYINNSSLKKYGFELPLRYLLFKLREWDYISGHRPDYLIANSMFTSRRIKKYWGLNSEVIHPPVNVERFKFNLERENFYLSVCRLVPNKRVDLLIKAFNKLGLTLILVGDGPEKAKLKKLANHNIKFYGSETDAKVEKLMSTCRAFVYAGIEDFGIAPIEAMASGAPIIALAKGGILDSVNCLTNFSKNKIPTGILFKEQNSLIIKDTVSWFEDKKVWKKFNPEIQNQFSQNFSEDKFKKKLDNFIIKSWDKFKKN